MDFATNEEILYAHDQLLRGKNPFDQEHINIIKANDSRYIQACPGSGKTTTLLAKLLILANRMPFEDCRGVCVLTHTNVAIDEIKARLGAKADILFRYPNYFGTIQTFVHKFIADQALFYYYGSHIEVVDNDIARLLFRKKYFALPFGSDLSKYIYGRIKAIEHRLDIETINSLGGLDLLLSANVIAPKGKRKVYYVFLAGKYKNELLNKEQKKQIVDYGHSWYRNRAIEILDSIKILPDNSNFLIAGKTVGADTNTGKAIIDIKERLYREGVLSYDDAYKLSFKYIEEVATSERIISENRFKYLFLDEMQDCDTQQRSLIEHVFDDSKVIVQRFGDYCQAIFNNSDIFGECVEDLRNQSKITLSNRFGDNIAKPLQTICIEDNTDLKGNPEVLSLRPTILVYENPEDVLPKFTELLQTKTIGIDNPITLCDFANKRRQADPLYRINIKAIGWRAQSGKKDNLSLSSYFPAFVREAASRKIDMLSILNYLSVTPNTMPKACADNIINAIIKYLDLSGVTNGNRRYTKKSLLSFLEERNKLESLKDKTMKWVKDIYDNKDKQLLISEITGYIDNNILSLFAVTSSKEAKEFVDIKDIGPADNLTKSSSSNIYKSENTEIEIATVHSVKGETHVATLYLETFFNRYYESQRAGDQIKGEIYNGNDTETLKTLKVMYVGMSRPTHFLCFAIKKDRFDHIDSEELRNIWDVVHVDHPNALI